MVESKEGEQIGHVGNVEKRPFRGHDWSVGGHNIRADGRVEGCSPECPAYDDQKK